MDFVDFLRAVFALAVTLGFVGLFAFLLRKYGPEYIARFQAKRETRRLTLVETLVLDPSRRLVLVRLDDTERLILLGEGRTLSEAPAKEPRP